MGFSLQDKIVLITGASSGIGKASAELFAKEGAHVILTARRKDRLDHLRDHLEKQYRIQAASFALDVRNRHEVEALIANLPSEWKPIDILLNNAGLALTTDSIQEGDPENWDTMIQVNLSGLLYMTRAVLPGMLKRDCGHIINISSIAGYDYYAGGNVYSATKHAVKAISKSLRIDLVGTALRVSEVAPGAVETEFSEVRFKDKNRAKAVYKGFTPLTAEDVADAVIYCASRPLHVDVAEMILFPTAQASAHHIHRNHN